MTREMGKPIRSAREEVSKCATACRYYAEHAQEMLAGEGVDGADHRVEFEPLGPILAVMPWNFPLWQVIRFAAPALVAGNVGLLKHASNVPGCARYLEELWCRAGAIRGVFRTLLVESHRIQALIADRRVAAVTLTGSDGAGRSVAAAAGASIKPCVLELGGSDPFIVLPSANLDRAIAAAVRARTINNGQSCIAAKRFIVTEPVYDAFLEGFVAGMQGLRMGDPKLETTELGPLATPAIRAEVAGQVRRLVEGGARLVLGGVVPQGPGNFYPATVLDGFDPALPVAGEEIFGPVALVLRARAPAHALQLANDTEFGLGASVWTSDRQEAERFERELRAGSVFVNSMVISDPRFPFGGVKASGYGRELGEYGLREFVNVKTVRRWFDG